MENKYTVATAHALQQRPQSSQHSSPPPCPDCGATGQAIRDNQLPDHHIDYSCECATCGCKWSPNRED